MRSTPDVIQRAAGRRPKPDDLGALGRFSEPALAILESLARAPKHGYALMEDIEATHGISLCPGTLYGALSRLEERGLVEALSPVERRKPYRLTRAGAGALRERLLIMRQFAERSLRRLAEAGA